LVLSVLCHSSIIPGQPTNAEVRLRTLLITVMICF
jgi:hypothetical protein